MFEACVITLLAFLTTTADGKIIFDRTEMNLTTFPPDINIAVEILILKRNFIERISATDLSLFVDLTEVNLYGNRIAVLEDGCFDNNGKLQNLRIDLNKIRHWPISLGPLVYSLKNLIMGHSIMRDIVNFDLRSQSLMNYIALGGNNFNEMGIDILKLMPRNLYQLILNSCSYSRLPNFNTYIPGIKRLNIQNNDIQVLSVDDFRDLTNLNTLQLQRNKLQTLPDLYHMKNLEHLQLYGNPLVCNSIFCWVILWNYVKTSTLTIDNAACHAPDDLFGVVISNIDPVYIACYEGRYVSFFNPAIYVLLFSK